LSFIADRTLTRWLASSPKTARSPTFLSPADETGRKIWAGLIDGFPDLTNEVTAVHVGDEGRTVTAEVTISGTQARDAFGIENKSRFFSLPHVFIVQTNDRCEITSMKAYWDNATWFAALGKTTLNQH
jgi:hypothetical protein